MNSIRRTARKLRGVLMRTMPLMITCRETERFLIDYLEGTLPARQRAIFDLHLRLCRNCRNYLEDYRRAIAIARTSFHEPDDPAAEHMPRELVEAVLAARDAQQ